MNAEVLEYGELEGLGPGEDEEQKHDGYFDESVLFGDLEMCGFTGVDRAWDC